MILLLLFLILFIKQRPCYFFVQDYPSEPVTEKQSDTLTSNIITIPLNTSD